MVRAPYSDPATLNMGWFPCKSRAVFQLLPSLTEKAHAQN
uniref:Uncharacterized protein n=1 Tax=Anguilla anguilla TaxID=7936 RepID=A0A0E9W572_ANGAN